MISAVGNPLMGSQMIQALGKMQQQMTALSTQASAAPQGDLNMLSKPELAVQGQESVRKAPLIEGPAASDTVGEFAAMLSQAFEHVNVLQNESSSMQSRFDVGDRSVTLADVMIASQKSSISFEATLQVRNRMVDAYKTIMQMQI